VADDRISYTFPMLEPQEEYMLAKSWCEYGDPNAAHRLVTSHLRLVVNSRDNPWRSIGGQPKPLAPALLVPIGSL
jgi:hypothetical protein